MNQRDDILQELVNIYLRSLKPGWSQLKTLLDIGEQGGLWLSGTSYAYYPDKKPETFTATWFDADGEMLEKSASALMLELWEHEKSLGQVWHAATLTIYPDQSYSFSPSTDAEKSIEDILNKDHQP